MIVSFLIGLAGVAVYLWQDGVSTCYDGARFTSCGPQPKPFHRRFHFWPPKMLAVISIASAVCLTGLLGSWQAAAMFVSLPGVWFCVTHPTTVDMPAMLLAWTSAVVLPAHPFLSVALSLGSGLIHERGPVFAAVYALSPLPLLGLLAVQWWARPAPKPIIANDSDRFVGHGLRGALKAHRGARDLLGTEGLLWPLRCVLFASAWLGTSMAGFTALAVSAVSRLLSTDAARSMIWAAPPMLAGMPEIPPWVVAIHVVTFKRQV